MHVFGMRRAPVVHEIELVFVEKADGVHDQFAVLIMAHRFAKPRRFRIGRVGHIQIDPAYLLLPLPEHPDLFGRLDEEDRLGGEQQLPRRAAGPATRLRRKCAMSVEDLLVVFAHQLLRPFLQIGIFRV